jgi:hypothetical protein
MREKSELYINSEELTTVWLQRSIQSATSYIISHALNVAIVAAVTANLIGHTLFLQL